MKMKKIVSIAVSAALLVSMTAATAFAVGSTPSKTGTDADAGKSDVTVSGPASSDGMTVEIEITDDSAAEETKLKEQGLEGYLGTAAADRAAEILGTTKQGETANGIKQVIVKGYSAEMGSVTLRVPFAALPKAGTRVAVVLHIVYANGSVANVPLDGVVVEESATGARKVEIVLDATTMMNIQGNTAYITAVTTK